MKSEYMMHTVLAPLPSCMLHIWPLFFSPVIQFSEAYTKLVEFTCSVL